MAAAAIGAFLVSPATANGDWESPILENRSGGFELPVNLPFASSNQQGDGSAIGPAGPIKIGGGGGDEDVISAPLPGPGAMGLVGITVLSMRRRRPGH